jgi:sensor histidine kinase YesM
MLRTKRIVIILYFFIWALVFLGPFLRNMQDLNVHSLNRMTGDWINLFLFFILFLINLYFLVPKLLFNNKKSQYTIIVIITVLLVIAIDILLHNVLLSPKPDIGMHLTYHRLNDLPLAQGSVIGNIFNNLITAVLIIGTSTAIELMFKWTDEEKRRKDIEKEQLKTNLALLRHQVSPHFFMNTLNNIHSLIEINSEKAQDAVVRLSTLMRYLLYDSAQNKIELKKEIEFISSFISLMQLRHSDEVEVKIMIPEQIPNVKIPPMLFISLLENAFKHGVCYPLKSYIYFELQVDENSLKCNIKNSKHKAANKYEGEYSGMGIDNIKESLKLLYGDSFLLNIFDKESEFEVNLKIPL